MDTYRPRSKNIRPAARSSFILSGYLEPFGNGPLGFCSLLQHVSACRGEASFCGLSALQREQQTKPRAINSYVWRCTYIYIHTHRYWWNLDSYFHVYQYLCQFSQLYVIADSTARRLDFAWVSQVLNTFFEIGGWGGGRWQYVEYVHKCVLPSLSSLTWIYTRTEAPRSAMSAPSCLALAFLLVLRRSGLALTPDLRGFLSFAMSDVSGASYSRPSHAHTLLSPSAAILGMRRWPSFSPCWRTCQKDRLKHLDVLCFVGACS